MHEPSRGDAGKDIARSVVQAAAGDAWAAGTARFARDTRGSTAIEYALIGSLIFLVAAGSIRLYVNRMGGVYNQISTAVAQGN
jgi:pilus assembly protein Flp/PilA